MLGWMTKPREHSAQALLGDLDTRHAVVLTQCTSPDEAVPAPEVAAPEPPAWMREAWLQPEPTRPPLWRLPPAEPTVQVRPPDVPMVVSSLGGRVVRGELDPLALGQAVHEALAVADLLGEGPTDEVLARRVAARWSGAIAERALEAVHIVRELLRELGCLELRREVPLMTGDAIVRVDALVRHPGGYLVLDYELEDAAPEELARNHGLQLQGYRTALAAMLGQPPAAAVVGLSTGTLVNLELP
jgi:hypothetical protein